MNGELQMAASHIPSHCVFMMTNSPATRAVMVPIPPLLTFLQEHHVPTGILCAINNKHTNSNFTALLTADQQSFACWPALLCWQMGKCNSNPHAVTQPTRPHTSQLTCVTSKVDPLLTSFWCVQRDAEAAALIQEGAVLQSDLARVHASAAESQRWELS